MADHRALLSSIRRSDQLIAYLRDELNWPIDLYDEEDELYFDFEPEELGIDPANAAKIQEIRRLRPLGVNDPWGIFFIKFEPKRLPVVALRRILSQVALKKRASANSATRSAWSIDDLLFISNYGEGDTRQISFAHFFQNEEKKDLPTLKVLGWDNQDTALHLDHVADTLQNKLSWPEDENDLDNWRKKWRSAFTLEHREVIDTSKKLSVKLAELARNIRNRAITVLELETENGPVTKLMETFKTTLVHDLDKDSFADMYAQTIAYGLLSARITKPSGDTADDMVSAMPVTNPFLKELMETFLKVGGRNGNKGNSTGMDFDELGVNEVVDLLDFTNMEAVVRDFGDRNPLEDPVIHFFEGFLQEYDSKIRKDRGVFYTPRPVVSFIVRSVDEMLRTEFGLEYGLADTTTWGEMTKRFDNLEIPEGATADQAFVQILDPATGTGTFLVEVIDIIYKTMTNKWKKEGRMESEFTNLWNNYVPNNLLPRLHGYELMMAPYAISHMKIGLKLKETDYDFESKERVKVYLTNALEPASDYQLRLSSIPALAHEANEVNEIKRDQRFTVVIGNPPYSGVSSNRNKWIEDILKGKSLSQTNIANYYEVEGKSILEKKIWLKDDYVKFMRLSHFLLDKSSVGIHGMITNHSFVDSPTCRGMRNSMLEFYSRMHFIDLHGSRKKSEESPDGLFDENVFNIMSGVAIAICSRNGASQAKMISSFDLWGKSRFKYNWLLERGLGDIEWNKLIPKSPYFLLVKRSLEFDSEYLSYYSLKDIFPFYGTGIQTSRDSFATDIDRSKLENRLQMFFDGTKSDTEIKDFFKISDTRSWKVNDIRRSTSFEKVQKVITKFLFRSFDLRWIALTKDVVDWPRSEVMSCVADDRIGMLCSRQQSTPGFRHVLAVNHPVDMFCISNKSREGQTVFPLFVKDKESLFKVQGEDYWRLNIGEKFYEKASRLLDDETRESDTTELTERTAANLFNYIYAVLYSLSYRNRYSDLLKMDYPRVPLPLSPELFQSLNNLGRALVSLHLMKTDKMKKDITHLVGEGVMEIENVSYSDSTVWIDKKKTQGFHGISEELWNFHIGGYRVCEKWLKDRKSKRGNPGRILSSEDIEHYQKIVVAISETIRIMTEIDEVIELHGGWPGAFQTESNSKSTEPP